MNVIQFFADFLIKLDDNLGYAVLFFACIVKIITLIMTNNEIKTLQISKIIEPYYDELHKKYAGNPEKLTKELFTLQKNYGYNIFAGISSVIIHSILAALLTYLFMHPQQYLYAVDTSVHFLWFNDLVISPLRIITRQETSSIFVLLGSLICPAVSAVIYYYISKFIANRSFVDKKKQQLVILAVLIAAGIFAPQAVSLYLAVILSLTALHYFIMIKFFPLNAENYKKKKK